MADNLKPCPFCGGEVELVKQKGDEFEFVLVSCKNCDAVIAIGGSDNEQKVTEAWNNRPTPWHTGTPTEREWVLGIFREVDTGWINPVPFVCEYLQGLKTKATTEEGWIIKDCTDIDQSCDYYKKLQCIAWQKIEEGEGRWEK